jgi:HD-GYP domain-containing protein (c-di-GMP phosphodiesterase class II)
VSERTDLDFLSEDTLKRCPIRDVTGETPREFSEITSETFPHLYELVAPEFSLHIRIDNVMVEFIRPGEWKRERLDQIWTAMRKKGRFYGMYVATTSRRAFDRAIQDIRRQKINAVLAKEPTLDRQLLNSFADLSHVSNLIVKGGITNETAELVKASTASMVSGIMDNAQAVATLSRMATHDPTLYEHSASMSMICAIIATRCLPSPMQPKETETLCRAALYHDVGKTMIPSEILNKPGKLTPEEYEVVKTHAALGREELDRTIKSGVPIDPAALILAGDHHERWMGHGYPNRKKGRLEDDPVNGIHLYARIAMIADVYSALLMQRVYKPAYDSVESLKIMIDIATKDYDPEIFKPFVRHIASTINSYQKRSGRGKIIMVDQGGVTIKK